MLALSDIKKFDLNSIFFPFYKLGADIRKKLSQKTLPYKTLEDKDEENGNVVATHAFFNGKRSFHLYEEKHKDMPHIEKHMAADAFMFTPVDKGQNRQIIYLNDLVITTRKSGETNERSALDFFREKVHNGEGEIVEDMHCALKESLMSYDKPSLLQKEEVNVVGDVMFKNGKQVKYIPDTAFIEKLEEEIKDSNNVLRSHHEKILKKQVATK